MAAFAASIFSPNRFISTFAVSTLYACPAFSVTELRSSSCSFANRSRSFSRDSTSSGLGTQLLSMHETSGLGHAQSLQHVSKVSGGSHAPSPHSAGVTTASHRFSLHSSPSAQLQSVQQLSWVSNLSHSPSPQTEQSCRQESIVSLM